MSIRAYLYDASGIDTEVELTQRIIEELNEKRLLWVDVHDYDEAEVRRLAGLMCLSRDSIFALLQTGSRPRVDHYGSYSQFNINTLEEVSGKYSVVEVNFVVGVNRVITVHDKPVRFLEGFDERIRGDSALGQLDAAAFLATLLDSHVTGYFRLLEDLGKEIDRIDAHAMRPRHTRDLLGELARLRQKVAFVRRLISPHREVYAALALPDFQAVTGPDSAHHFRILSDRLDRAIEAVENSRELLVGSFDMFTTKMTLRTNDVMKALTLASFIWFPASVIVGIASMILPAPVRPASSPGFWIMLGSIGLVALITMGVARLKRWI